MRRCVLLKTKSFLPELLRDVIHAAPSSGIALTEVELKLKENIQKASLTADNDLSSSWMNALPEVNDMHYTVDGILYACDWEKILKSVSALMPREGVTELELIDRIRDVEPHFSLDNVTLGSGGSLSSWIRHRFPHILAVSRSAGNEGIIIYRLAEQPLSPEAEGIERVLTLLGRGKLPVYTDFSLIAPILPSPIRPERGKWMEFLQKAEVQQYFDVEVEASVRLSPGSVSCTVFVDGTSVDVNRLDELLETKGLVSPLCVVKVFRRANGPVWSTDDAVLQEFLEPEHAIGAAIASIDGLRDVNVRVVCGDAARERYEAALTDLLERRRRKVKICTPSGEL